MKSTDNFLILWSNLSDGWWLKNVTEEQSLILWWFFVLINHWEVGSSW